MIPDMRFKYKKCWGSIEKPNHYTCFAILLDPCFKKMLLSHVFENMLEKMVTEENHLSPSTIKLRVMSKTREVVKDILSIQMSTVASESAFSTSNRILDEYRTRLTTLIVEALMCIEDAIEVQYDKGNEKKVVEV
ncbi:hypothetical protein LXL04_034685 [Taraxacum kok-saghyz]